MSKFSSFKSFQFIVDKLFVIYIFDFAGDFRNFILSRTKKNRRDLRFYEMKYFGKNYFRFVDFRKLFSSSTDTTEPSLTNEFSRLTFTFKRGEADSEPLLRVSTTSDLKVTE